MVIVLETIHRNKSLFDTGASGDALLVMLTRMSLVTK